LKLHGWNRLYELFTEQEIVKTTKRSKFHLSRPLFLIWILIPFAILGWASVEILLFVTCKTITAPGYPDLISCSPNSSYTIPITLFGVLGVYIYLVFVVLPGSIERRQERAREILRNLEIAEEAEKKLRASMSPAEWAIYREQVEANKKMNKIIEIQNKQNQSPTFGIGLFKDFDN